MTKVVIDIRGRERDEVGGGVIGGHVVRIDFPGGRGVGREGATHTFYIYNVFFVT